jgi:hypothetical protein
MYQRAHSMSEISVYAPPAEDVFFRTFESLLSYLPEPGASAIAAGLE